MVLRRNQQATYRLNREGPNIHRSPVAKAEIAGDGGSSDYAFHFDDGGPDYFVIQDFRFTGGLLFQDYGTGNASHNITIRRNYIHDVGANWVLIDGQNGDATYFTVEDNKMMDCAEYNPDGAEQCFNVNHAINLIIKDNWFIGDTDSTYYNTSGCNNLEIHESQNVLIEGNIFDEPPDQANLAIKENGGYDCF